MRAIAAMTVRALATVAGSGGGSTGLEHLVLSGDGSISGGFGGGPSRLAARKADGKRRPDIACANENRTLLSVRRIVSSAPPAFPEFHGDPRSCGQDAGKHLDDVRAPHRVQSSAPERKVQ